MKCQFRQLCEEVRIRLEATPVVWTGSHASEAEWIFGISGSRLLYGIISMDSGYDVDRISRSVQRHLSIERLTNQRKRWGVGDFRMVASAAIEAFFQSDARGFTLLPYANTSFWQGIGMKYNLPVLAPHPSLIHYLANKINMIEVFNNAGVRVPPAITAYIGLHSKYSHVSQRLGVSKWVMRLPYGSGGTGTYVISDDFSFEAIKATLAGQRMLLSPFLTGAIYNHNCCVTDTGVFMSKPSRKSIGTVSKTNGAVTGLGNDWGCLISRADLHAFFRASTAIGEQLHSRGYRGVFGVDYLHSGNGCLHALEINPRFQGTTRFDAQLSSNIGIESMALLHLATFLGLRVVYNAAEIIRRMTLLDRGGYAKVFHLGDSAARLSGGHSLDAARHFALSDPTQGLTLTAGVPKPDLMIEPQALICRVESDSRVLDHSTGEWLDPIQRVADDIRSRLSTQNP
jgi:hypothetical protein